MRAPARLTTTSTAGVAGISVELPDVTPSAPKRQSGGGHVNVHGHAVAVGKQRRDQVAPDEASAAREQHMLRRVNEVQCRHPRHRGSELGAWSCTDSAAPPVAHPAFSAMGESGPHFCPSHASLARARQPQAHMRAFLRFPISISLCLPTSSPNTPPRNAAPLVCSTAGPIRPSTACSANCPIC